jgi:predicted nucleic acid-binding protein
VARYFLDSNVFLYALGGEHSEKAPCRKVLELAAAGELEAATSSEVLQEVLYVRLRRGNRADALDSVRLIRELVGEIFPVTASDVEDACDLLAKHPSLDARDAVHAAVARKNKVGLIVSVDRDFDRIRGIHRLSPAQAAGV